MSTESLSVLVAGLAVVVGASLQYATIRSTRRNTVSQLRTDVTVTRLAALREAMAEYMTNSWWMDRETTSINVGNQESYSEDYYERADRENRLDNVIRLYLDPGDPNHERLLGDLEYLREYNRTDLWLSRRNRLVATARQVFETETSRALGE